MVKNCRRCSVDFTLTDDDLAFYDKVSPIFGGVKCAVPAPSLCPLCRVQRRMHWRNDRTFYHRKCDLTGKQIISLYPEKTSFPVYHQSVWYGDRWDPMSYGQDFDFNRPFFDQWHELFQKVPRLGMDVVNCENSDYCNYCGDDKNCYIDIAGEANEDCYFCLFTKYSKNCVDCTFAYHSTLCYECIQCYNCYNVRYSISLDDCSDCSFCFDCKGSKNCFLSTNLRNKEYYILNQPYSKEEYEKKIAEFRLDTFEGLQKTLALWNQFRVENGFFKATYQVNCENCIGDGVKNSQNCFYCFNTTNARDCKYLYDVLDATDCQDLNYSLYKPEVSYELISTLQMRFSAFTMASHYCFNVFYSDLCNNSNNLFGCIGLNRKEYCILNKQYTKEEYEALVPRIIAHMEANGEWGEFFPNQLSPFGYNETVAMEYMPLSQDEVVARGWLWREEMTGSGYSGAPFVIPDSISEVSDDLSKKILVCEQSGKPYKIIPQELKFYKNLSIPVPRISPFERHKNRNFLRPARQLWQRACTQCGITVSSAYAPERPEKIYCEKCYLEAVY